MTPQLFIPSRLIIELRDACGIDAERIGALIGLSGSQVRNIAAKRRLRMDYETAMRLINLHAESMARVSPETRTHLPPRD